MSFRMKIHRQGKEVLVAASDEELVGRKFKEGILRLDVREAFYGTEVATEEILVQHLRMCTIANLVGVMTVSIAVRAGFVDIENVLEIEGVPHAQLVRTV